MIQFVCKLIINQSSSKDYNRHLSVIFMNYGNKIIKEVEVGEFSDIIKKYSKNQIECTRHTFFRLNEKQRKIYTLGELIKILMEEKPILVGIQENKNYAVFYKYKEKHLKIILRIDFRKVNIVTFFFINEWQLPRL